MIMHMKIVRKHTCAILGTLLLLLFVAIPAVGQKDTPAVETEESAKKEDKAEPAPAEPLREFTLEELREYDGSDPDLPILLALKGTVFDVSSGKKFYYPGKSYAAFAGRDVTRNTAMFSKDPKILDRTDYPEKRAKYLNKVYEGTYKRKYPIVGWINNPTQPPEGWVEPGDEEEVLEDDNKPEAGAGSSDDGSITGWLSSAWSSLTGNKAEL